MSTKEAFDVAHLAVCPSPVLSWAQSDTDILQGSGKGVSRLMTACPQTTQFPYKQKPAKLPNQGRLQVCGEGVCICIDLELHGGQLTHQHFLKPGMFVLLRYRGDTQYSE